MHHSICCMSFAFLLCASLPSYAKPAATRLTCASASDIKTEAEVESGPRQGIYNVHVTFVGKRPPDNEVDRVLRAYLSVAAKRDGSKDILGSPWFQKRAGDSPNYDTLLHPYGGLRYLSYEAASKTIGIRELKLKKKAS